MKKTALTDDLLSRFERLVNPETLTDSQIEKVEHYAYCAELVAGQKENVTPWGWFCYLVKEFLTIDLESLESQTKPAVPKLTKKKNEEFFNRCEYNVYRYNAATPERKIFVVRNYGAGESCIDACIEHWKHNVPSDIQVREIRSNADSVLPDAVEFVFIKTGAVIVKICDFVADPMDYSADELIANPSLVQATDVEEFIRFYRSRWYRS